MVSMDRDITQIHADEVALKIAVAATGSLLSLLSGFLTAFPAVLNHANATIHSNSTDVMNATLSERSLIAAIPGYSGAFGFIIFPFMMDSYGRKTTSYIIGITITIGWITVSCARNVPTLICARAFLGSTLGSIVVASTFISEYCDPKTRGSILVLKKVSYSFGILIAHIMMLYLTWRQVAIFCVSVSILLIFLTSFWTESPDFLALKGRFDECEQTFIKLHGNSPKKRIQLRELITGQEKLIHNRAKRSIRLVFEEMLKKLSLRDFKRGSVISIASVVVVEAAGRHYFGTYIVQMLTELTGDKSVATYISIGSHSLSVIALLIAIILVKVYPRRSLLFTTGSVALVMLMISIIALALKVQNVYVKWCSLSLLVLYSFVCAMGAVPITFSLTAEVFPLEHRGLGLAIVGVIWSCLIAAVTHITPFLLKYLEVPYTMTIYGTILAVALVVLYFKLPETKDRTLTDIAFEMKGLQKPSEETEIILIK